MEQIELDNIRYPKEHANCVVGTKNIMNNGLIGEVIEYQGHSNITVRLNDGTIYYKQKLDRFNSGNIGYKIDKTGETRKVEDITLTIIKYTNYRNVTVQLSTGEIIENTTYDKFKSYKSKHELSIGMKSTTRQGIDIEIIGYINDRDIAVQFEDGTVLEHQTLKTLKTGGIRYKKDKYINIELVFICKDVKHYLCKCRRCTGEHILRLNEMKDFDCTVRG